MAARHRAPKTVKDIYRGYMPVGLPQHRPPRKIKPWWRVIGKPMVTLYPKQEIEGYSEEPEYPPLNDGSKKGLTAQVRLDWYESLKILPTFEEKAYEIGRHASHYIAHINNWMPTYNSLPMVQYLTRTHVINSLPENYKVKGEESRGEDKQSLIEGDRFLDLKRALLDQIALDKYNSIKKGPFFVSGTIRDGNRNPYLSEALVQNIANVVKKSVALEANTDLLDYQYDLKPALRSWWYHSGLKAPNNKVFYKSRVDGEGKINQIIQMDGSAALAMRSNYSMEPVVSQTDPLVTNTSLIQEHCYPLKFYGGNYKFKWPVALAGYWPELELNAEKRFDFPHTCFLTTDCLHVRNGDRTFAAKTLTDDEDCLNGQAILTAFGWLNSLSMYHGYTPFQELDYPFTCQVITTDGQDWTFHVYQMNAHTFHRDLGAISKNNICWTSGKLRLYEDYRDGQFIGLNEDVMKLLIRFMSQQTSRAYTAELELRKYLSEDLRTEEERLETRKKLRDLIEGRGSGWAKHQWKVPIYEHIFFRSKEMRNRIRHMKPMWHIPKPKYPKIFE